MVSNERVDGEFGSMQRAHIMHKFKQPVTIIIVYNAGLNEIFITFCVHHIHLRCCSHICTMSTIYCTYDPYSCAEPTKIMFTGSSEVSHHRICVRTITGNDDSNKAKRLNVSKYLSLLCCLPITQHRLDGRYGHPRLTNADNIFINNDSVKSIPNNKRSSTITTMPFGLDGSSSYVSLRGRIGEKSGQTMSRQIRNWA